MTHGAGDEAKRPGMSEHEARPAILAELHARPFLPVEAPRRIYHYAFSTDEEEARDDRLAITSLAEANGVVLPPEDAKFHRFALGDWDLRWEQHTEFTTYTWSTPSGAAEPFLHPDPVGDREITFRAPGRLVVATHLALVEGGPSHEFLATLFNAESLCVVGAAKGAA